MRITIAFLLIGISLAGCADDAPTDDAGLPDAPDEPLHLPDLWDVEADVAWWEEFVTAGKRDAYVPDTPATHNTASRDAIVERLEAMGADVDVRLYEAGALGASAPAGAGSAQAAAVVGTFEGNRSERIGLIAHYDTQAGTIEGAYDNGGGTGAVLSICSILAQIELDYTVDCVLFDAEEVGAVASGHYVDEVEAEGIQYDLVLGFDMIGINCFGTDWKMHQWVDSNAAPWLTPFVQNVTAGLGLQEDCAEVHDTNNRNSDEANFYAAGIPTVRYSGGLSAGDYPQYHMPDDTPAFIYDYVGGKENWVQGYALTVETAAALAMAYDDAGREAIEA